MSEMTLIHPDKVQAAGYDPARLVNMNVLHIIDAQNGPGRSAMAKRFGLGSIEEASAYWADQILGGRLVACTEAVLANRTKSAREIFGAPDDLKFFSCMTLFAIAVPQQAIFQLALNTFFAGERDPLTVALLA